MQTFIDIWQGFLAMPLWVKLWLVVLTVSNGILPLFFLEHLVAQVTLFAILIGLPIAYYIVKSVGFTKLLGLMHAPWLLMVYIQAHTLLTTQPTGNFANWLWLSFVVSLISLVLDIYDVLHYAKQKK